MKLRSLAAHYTPDFIKSLVRAGKRKAELRKFKSLESLRCKADNLKPFSTVSLEEVFESERTHALWDQSKRQLNRFEISKSTGGVNPGDRRAVYYLICHFQPANVLEIGTHIGASTIHIASGLFYSRIANNKEAHLTTLDIRDVNSTFEKPWLKYGASQSPHEMLKEMNYDDIVTFKTDKSLRFFDGIDQKFDFIFLDGDHTVSTVYQEIPLALKALRKDGVILLHDYFPDNEPLWADKPAIPGPYQAVNRLIKEGANMKVLPLGKLPWKTKLDSNITSLALLMREN